MIDKDASIVEMLRDAGAVLVAKLTSGEIAQGDRWFGGQTKSPWDPTQGSGGSSAGPGSATAAGLVGFSIGTETSGSILGPSARCGVTGLRPTLGRISRDGVMVLSWTQDRLGPMCRYAEDCALVMSVIARPDNRDLSVVDLPFNWNAQIDIKKLRVGYLKAAFEENTDATGKQHQQQTYDALAALGLNLVPVEVPEFTTDVSAINVESATFFDEFMRSGRDKQLTNPGRAGGWKGARVLPAPDYLQSQRIRMMMMMKLAEATAHVDVYLGPGNGGGPAGGGRGGPGGGGAPGARGRCRRNRRQGPGQRHSAMANLATYPAVSVPERLQRRRHADEHHVLRAAIRRIRTARRREGLSGRDGLPPEASDARDVRNVSTGQQHWHVARGTRHAALKPPPMSSHGRDRSPRARGDRSPTRAST